MGENPLWFAFVHFYHMDHANAAFHLAPVKFSPITFALAQEIEDKDWGPYHEVIEVQSHKNLYPLDQGR